MVIEYTVKSVVKRLALAIVALVIIEDIVLVLISYGTWGVFGQKMVMTFIALVAFIATIEGKVGINTSWMEEKRIFNTDNLTLITLAILIIGLTLLLVVVAIEPNIKIWAQISFSCIFISLALSMILFALWIEKKRIFGKKYLTDIITMLVAISLISALINISIGHHTKIWVEISIYSFLLSFGFNTFSLAVIIFFKNPFKE